MGPAFLTSWGHKTKDQELLGRFWKSYHWLGRGQTWDSEDRGCNHELLVLTCQVSLSQCDGTSESCPNRYPEQVKGSEPLGFVLDIPASPGKLLSTHSPLGWLLCMEPQQETGKQS